MNRKREKKFVMGFWNYNDAEHSGPDQVPVWKDLGLNTAMMPYYRNEEEIKRCLPLLLDALNENGMKAILSFGGLSVMDIAKGEDKYREEFRKRYEEFGHHPAVLGFFPGEEPNKDTYKYFAQAFKIQNEIAPELIPFADLGADGTYTDYICEVGKLRNCGFGNYSQMEPEERGTDDYFRLMKKHMEVCDKYNMDCWATLLSSAHYRFRAPNEADYTWQINTAAACGCTGIIWFRLYDKLAALDYRGSPIDEYGGKGEHYNDMKRANTRFMTHHGELIMKLERKATFFITKHYGGYPGFPEEGYSKIKRVYNPDNFYGCYDLAPTPGIVSFFEDNDGEEYVAIVNNTPYEPGSIILEFSDDVKFCRKVYFNGEREDTIISEKTNDGKERDLKVETWLAPGQMEIFHIG